MKQQTAVEFLENELYEKFEIKGDYILYSEILYKAKVMEKEQIEKSYNEGWLQCNIEGLPEKSRKHFKTADEYFDFTYTQSSE